MSVINNDHMGWLLCDGRTLNVNEFYLLWRVVGYAFGSNAGNSNTFKLPNAAGRVPGVVGTGVDSNTSFSTFTIALGDSVGEYTHTLTIDEMPAHKHGSVDVSGNTNGDGNTTIDGLHNHAVTDPGHSHSYFNQPNSIDVQEPITSRSVADNVDVGQLTGSSTTGISLVSTGTHFHSMGSTGGSNYHNNIQPLIGLGNMFIFCGKYMYPSDAASPFAGYPYLSNSQIL